MGTIECSCPEGLVGSLVVIGSGLQHRAGLTDQVVSPYVLFYWLLKINGNKIDRSDRNTTVKKKTAGDEWIINCTSFPYLFVLDLHSKLLGRAIKNAG